jgi:hypothetical protein
MQPILMLAIVSGQSMHYEVFLLSRVCERYDIAGSRRRPAARRRHHQLGADHHGGPVRRARRPVHRADWHRHHHRGDRGRFIVWVLLVRATTARDSVLGSAGVSR